MKIKLSKKQELQIINYYIEGKTVTEIRNLLGIKWIQPITNALKRNNLGDFISTKRKTLNTEETIRKIVELRRAGLNVLQIANKMGFYHQLIQNILKREGEYVKKEQVPKRKYTIENDYFEELNTSIKCYIVGFICADGYLSKNSIEIVVSIKDIDILEKVKTALSSNTEIRYYNSKNPYRSIKTKEFCEMCKLKICSKKLVDHLKFIPSNKTYSLNSSVMDYIPEKFYRDFLRGYFDGDGNVSYGKTYSSGIKYNINVCGNKEFLEGTFNKCFPSSNKMYFMKNSKQCWVWKLSGKSKVEEFLEYLYKDADIYLDRKFEIYKCAHVKPVELLETQTENLWAISSEASKEERSETIETSTIVK